MTRIRVLELRHVECESPGAYGTGLAGVAKITTVRAWREPIPHDASNYDALLVMGGPMGANDGVTLPWIDDEIALLQRALAADIPVWGVCLGSQLLARALGANVSTGPVGEIGIAPVTLADAARTDPVFGVAPGMIPAMHWHYDTFAIPEAATLLASSATYANQLFRHGLSYGVQFHLEVDDELTRRWLDVPEYRNELIAALGPDGPHTVLDDVQAAQRITTPLAATLIRRWAGLIATGLAHAHETSN